MKFQNKILMFCIFTFVVTACAKDSTESNLEKATAYDGYYFSKDSIVQNNNKESFSIKNGLLSSKKIKGRINERTMKLVSDNKEYTIKYFEGELTIFEKKNKPVLVGYKKNTSSFTYIDEIYGTYSRDIIPKFQEIVKDNEGELKEGKYINLNPSSFITAMDINKNELLINHRELGTLQKKTISLAKISIDDPNLGYDSEKEIDKKIIQAYLNCQNIEDLRKITGFSMKYNLDSSKKEYLELYFPRETDDSHFIIEVKIVSNSLLKNEIIDDKFEKKI